MNAKMYRELYEGLTQKDAMFRNAIYRLSDSALTDTILSELELAQNRLNHAMLGIHPIYRREVELSGIVNYAERALSLFRPDMDDTTPFSELDPAYVSFLESQKRIYNVKECMPLSSVALKTSCQWLAEDGVRVPDISEVPMHLPKEPFPHARKVLETAFARNMVMMNHLQEEIEKHGLDTVYGSNRDQLFKYCQSNSFDFEFDRSVDDLTETAAQSASIDKITNRV